MDKPDTISDKSFSSLDEFLMEGILALSKNKSFSADEFGEAMMNTFPNSPWTKADAIHGIAKLVRLGRLDLHPIMIGSSLKYEYIVK